MLKTSIALAGAAAVLAAAPAAAETLAVNGVVAPYCSVCLANVSSGTATIAFEIEQKIANLEVACNAPGGTSLIVDPQQGDLVGPGGRINYAMRLTSEESAFNIPSTDTDPSATPNRGIFTRNRTGFSKTVADGASMELFMNVNVASPPDQPDFNGVPIFPANNAPAGTYTETFVFTVSGL